MYVKPYTTAQPSILTPPVDATVCLNSTAKFYCSTDGDYLVWRVNGTQPVLLRGTTATLDPGPGIEGTLVVPGMNQFENTNFTCIVGMHGSTDDATSNPAKLFVQGTHFNR